MVDPFNYYSFQPVIHDWCNKGRIFGCLFLLFWVCFCCFGFVCFLLLFYFILINFFGWGWEGVCWVFNVFFVSFFVSFFVFLFFWLVVVLFCCSCFSEWGYVLIR